jgi:hypothetical protein
MYMMSPWDIFPNTSEEKTDSKAPTMTIRGYNNVLEPNAGNFQEYTYELEWIECSWKNIYKMTDLVTAYWYPWIRYPSK